MQVERTMCFESDLRAKADRPISSNEKSAPLVASSRTCTHFTVRVCRLRHEQITQTAPQSSFRTISVGKCIRATNTLTHKQRHCGIFTFIKLSPNSYMAVCDISIVDIFPNWYSNKHSFRALYTEEQ